MDALAADPVTAPVHDSFLRVFVVEDSVVIRERLASMLNSMPAVTVLGYAATAAEAIEVILSAPPDVAILDIKLAGSSGMQVLRAVRQRLPHMIVIMLTNHVAPIYRRACLDAGAHYFLDKSNEFQKLSEILLRAKSR